MWRRCGNRIASTTGAGWTRTATWRRGRGLGIRLTSDCFFEFLANKAQYDDTTRTGENGVANALSNSVDLNLPTPDEVVQELDRVQSTVCDFPGAQ